MLRTYHRTALEVCEGQEQDMAFESRSDVSIEEYMEMIRLKTSVLLAAALDMGGKSGGADDKPARPCMSLASMWGWPFQLQDDYLDAFGNPENFGKQVGGDILADKKTFLLIRALEKAQGADFEALQRELGPPQRRQGAACAGTSTAIWGSTPNCAMPWRARWPWPRGACPTEVPQPQSTQGSEALWRCFTALQPWSPHA